MFKKSKKKAEPRAPQLDYRRPAAYHYSAKRSKADKLFDRGGATKEEIRSAKMLRRAREIPTYFALLLILASALYLASLSTAAQITVDGSQELLRDRSAIQPKANQVLSSSLLNRSKFTFQGDKVEAELRQAFPEFAEVDVSTPLFRHRPHVVITLARPAALLSTGTHIYLIDDQGRALFDTTRNKPSFDTSDLPLLQDQSTLNIEVGKTALSRTQVAYVQEVRAQTEQKGLKIESMLMVSGGGELNVRFGGLPYYAKFNFFEDARKSTGTFLATKEKLDADKSKPTEYIDVRIPERAYVK